ncbi:MAG: HYR domain-containing protein [Bacteroidia bacterium]
MVVLEDNTPPAIICPGNQTLTANAQCNFLLPDYSTSAVPSDNCGVDTVIQTPAGGSVLLLGANAVEPVTLTVYDNAGNSKSCSFTVTLKDITLPTIVSCAPDTVVYADANCLATLGDYKSLLVATDNCGLASLIIDQAPFPGFPIIAGANSNTAVVLTATDASGNQTSCTFNVTVLDTIAPVIACPSSDIVATQGVNCSALVPDYTTLVSATDNCGSVSMAQTAEGLTYCSGLMLLSPFEDSLWIMDTTTFSILSSIQVTSNDGNIQGFNGMAQNPITGQYFVLVKLQGTSGRFLATLDTATATVDTVGNLGDSFAGITFSPDGRLFGVTGDGANVSETLYEIDPSNAAITLLRVLGNGNDGEVIVFNSSNGLIYHFSGLGSVNINQIGETIDTSTLAIAGLTLAGADMNEVSGAMYVDSNRLLTANIDEELFSFDIGSSSATLLTTGLPTTIRGLAFTAPVFLKTSSVSQFEDSVKITLVAMDASGNKDTCMFWAFAADSTAPVISCMGDTTVAADGNCQGQVPDFSQSSVTATDNCDDNPSITQSVAAGTNFSDSITVV